MGETEHRKAQNKMGYTVKQETKHIFNYFSFVTTSWSSLPQFQRKKIISYSIHEDQFVKQETKHISFVSKN